MNFRIFRANLVLKLALILAIIAGNITFASSVARADETGGPSNVTAVALPNKSATVSWTAADNETELGVTEYYVELPGYLADPNNVELCTVLATGNTNQYSCTLNNLPTYNESFLNYFFYVVAANANGKVNLSYRNSNSVTIYDVPQAPSVPRNVTGVAGTNSITVFWQTPVFDGASPITSYTAEIDEGSESCTASPTLTGYQSCVINGLNNGQSYTFTVFATNAIGTSEYGFSDRPVTPFVGNFDGLDSNSFDNYVDGHRQTRNLPSGKSLYNLRCESTANSIDLTLETIDTQNSNYSNLVNIFFSDSDYIHDLTCNTQTAAGPNGVFMTISNPSGSETMLYSLNPTTGEATDIALISFPDLQFGLEALIVGVAQDQSGILRVLFLTSDNNNPFGFPELHTGVINSATGAVGATVMVAQDQVVPLLDFELFPLEESLLPLGELDLPESDLIFLLFPDAVKIVLYQNVSSTTDSELVMGGLDTSGNLTESDNGDLLESLGAYLAEVPSEYLLNLTSPIIPSDYLNLLRDLLSDGSTTSFNTYQNQVYLLTGGETAGRIASLFSINLTSGHLDAVGDFPASSMPLGDGYLSTATTIDSNGIIWNLTGGVLQSESISGFQNIGDYQIAITVQSDSANQPSSDSNSIFVASSTVVDTPPPTPPSNSAPGAPTSVVATTTGKESATVSFAPPASDGGSTITTYTAVSTPGGITRTLTQAGSGTFTFDNLQPGTAYRFAVTATNAIGTSVQSSSNLITTIATVIASLSKLSFVDDGTGTGGKITWSGKNITSVLYTGPVNSYPGPYNYGAFTSGWNGRIRNLTPDTQYTISLYAISVEGIGETKSLTFKTGPALPESDIAETSSIKLTKLLKWVEENTFVPGEGRNMSRLLTKFDGLEAAPKSSYLRVPTSRTLNVTATSLTPSVCSVVSPTAKTNAGMVSGINSGTCSISYTVSGASRAPATLVKDFKFQ
jgi:hypothetical protein